MKYSYPMIRLLKRPHKFFVYWVGQPDYHIMDWAGCNFHFIRAPGQPKGGFDTPWEAYYWAESKTKEEIQAEAWGASGSFLKDEISKQSWDIGWSGGAESISFRGRCQLDDCKEEGHSWGQMVPPKEWIFKILIQENENRIRTTEQRLSKLDKSYTGKPPETQVEFLKNEISVYSQKRDDYKQQLEDLE